MMSVVYMLQCGFDGPIKIGTTGGLVHARILQIQAAAPYKLRWIGAFVGGREEEKAAHTELATHRLRGEWFYPTAAVLDFVVRMSGSQFDPEEFLETKCRRRELKIIRAALREPKRDLYTFASFAGCSHYEIRSWSLYLAPPSDAVVMRMMDALDRIDEVETDQQRAERWQAERGARLKVVECTSASLPPHPAPLTEENAA